MASEPISVKGLILSSDEYKDKDRMLTILTSTMGIIKACVKGASKQGSKTAFLSVPYMLCDFTLTDSHGFWYVKEALIVESNSGILNSLEAMAIASHIAKLLAKSVFQTEISKEAYELTVYAYYALGKFPESYKVIYSAFNARFLMISGFAVVLESCANCSSSLTRVVHVDLENSNCYCEECIKSVKTTGKLFKLSEGAIASINYFYEKSVSSIFTLKISDELQNEVYRFTTSYLSIQLDEEVKDPLASLLSFKFKR